MPVLASSSSSNGHNYKLLSYVLFAILVVLVTSMLCTAAVVYNRKMFLMKLLFNNTLQRSLHVASSNRLMCSGSDAHCHFRADPTVQPPVVATAEAPRQSRRRVSVRGLFSLDAAKFAAQIVAMLEQAAVQRVDPVPRADTEVLAVLSGGTRVNKNKNIGWVLRVHGGGGRDQIWVAFRGTQTNAEWQQDFKMEQVALTQQGEAANAGGDDGDIMAHRGFWETYLEVRDELRQTLRLHVTPGNTTLFITGHSLGAAIAVLALLDWIVLSPPAADTALTDVRCYVFGAPRVGNAAFVDAIMSRYRRRRTPLREFHVISNDEDIVPNIPLAVQPNLETPEMPWLYAQFPMKRFSTNWGSWTFNHTLPVHISFLNDLRESAVDDGGDDDETFSTPRTK
jgi:pimeloyl-ACP methyl ester carboxylesterase